MVDVAKKNAVLTTVKVTPDLLLEIVNEQNRLRNAGEGKIAQSDIVHRAWKCYVENLTSGTSPGKILGVKIKGRNVLQSGPEVGTLADISSDLSDTEKVYLHKCLVLLRSILRETFHKMVDALLGPLDQLNEHQPPNAPLPDTDRTLDEAISRSEDEIREIRAELHGDDPVAGETPDRDRKRRTRRPPAAGGAA